MINKKAQGMSLRVIIIAVVALIVLIILIAIFSGRIGKWGDILGKETEEGATKRCKLPGTENECGACTGEGSTRFSADGWVDCPGQGADCCFK